jgi:hypothetical protein
VAVAVEAIPLVEQFLRCTGTKNSGLDQYPLAIRNALLLWLAGKDIEFLSVEEQQSLEAWCKTIQPILVINDDSEQNSYHIYADDSLYSSSTADDEIWESANDLAEEIAGFAIHLTKMDAELLGYCKKPIYEVRLDKGFYHESPWAEMALAVQEAANYKRDHPQTEVVVVEVLGEKQEEVFRPAEHRALRNSFK